MGKIKIKAGKEAVEAAASSGDFEEAPVGIYVAKLAAAEPGYAKGQDGEQDKSRPYLKCRYQITGVGREGKKPEKNYSSIFDYVSFSEAAKWKLAQFGIAMGLPVVGGEIDGELEIEADKPGTIINKQVLIRVKADKDQNGDYRAQIGAVMPLEAPTLDDAAGDDDSDVVVEDEPSPFDDDGDDGEDGDGYLTEEELAEMDLKELGSIAKDFDLVPQEYVVKVRGKVNNEKTAAKLIEAILAAQGVDEGDDAGEAADDEDDEDPF